MASAKTCPSCGADLPGDTWQGLCPTCVVRFSLGVSSRQTIAVSPVESSTKTDSLTLNPTTTKGTIRYFGDYELLDEIARGGMGLVYRARQVSLNRLVAVKMILSGQLASGKFVERFQVEAEAAANLDHPHIVPIYEIGEHEGQHYFSMKLVEGGNLAEKIRGKSWPARQGAQLVATVARAIEYAHQRGVLHRDLKPSNILLDMQERPHVSDFGLARMVEQDSSLTGTEAVMGTPSYMAPEQAAGQTRQLTVTADVYSLGAVLFELLTGRPPFHAETSLATMRQVVEQEPPRPRALNGSLDRDVEIICLKCLEKDPLRRYGSAGALAEDLERWLRQEPILARPSNAWEVGRKWVRRKPALAASLAAVLLVFVAGLAGVLWQWQRAERNATRETVQRQHTEQANLKLEMQRAESLLGGGDVPGGLAQLARIVRQHPTNQLVAERLFSALNQRNFPLPVTEPLEHQGAVLDAGFSPDGLRVVTASADQTARVWDALTGKPVTGPLQHAGVVRKVSFSPDGRWVVTASEDKTARVWDAQTGEPVGNPLQHEDELRSARFSPDGKRVVTASLDNTARVWEASSGRLVTTVKHGYWVFAAEFSPDGQSIATAAADSTVRIWNARTGEPRTAPLGHDSWVQQVHFSPDGQHIASCSTAGDARIWDAHSGWPVGKPLREGQYVGDVRFSPDGQRLLTVSETVRVWDCLTGQQLVGPLRQRGGIESAEFSADGLMILTASRDKTAVVWDAHSGQPLCEPIRQRGELNAAHFSPDGQRVVTASSDKTARVWDVRHGQPFPNSAPTEGGVAFTHFSPDGKNLVMALNKGATVQWRLLQDRWEIKSFDNSGIFSEARYSPDGQRIVTISGSATIWDAHTLQPLTEPFAQVLNRDDPYIHSVQFSPDGKRIVTGSGDKTAIISDVETGQMVAGPLQHERGVHYEDAIWDAQFSPDGQKVVSASGDGTARVWNALTGEALTQLLRHDARVNRARFSPDGQRVISASADETARVWDVTTGKELFRLRHDNNVVDAEFSPDGTRILTASLDTTARLWEAHTGQPLGEPLKHTGRLTSARFSPDGERAITVSADGTARLWSARTGQPVSDPFKYDNKINTAEFSPDGAQVVVASGDGADIWEVPRAPLPVPDWLPALAESLAGQRVTENGLVEPGFRDELLQLKETLAKDSGTDLYSRWAKWFFADRNARTISAFSTLPTDTHVALALWTETLSSHREMARQSPTNGVVLAMLTAQMLKTGYSISNKVEEAEFLNRRAIQLSPTVAQCWASWAATLDQMGRISQALEANDRALQLLPTSHRCFNRKGVLLAKTNRLDEALQCFTQAIEMKEVNHERTPEALTEYRSNRWDVLKRMGRVAEAGADNRMIYGIAPRDPQAKPELLDLSAFYNLNLTNEWRLNDSLTYHGLIPPSGLRHFAGVDFDVRGGIQVAITDGQTKLFPNEVSGIPVGRAANRIHFLHADIIYDSETQLKAGSYVIHYSDGQQQEIALFNGKQIGAWFDSAATDADEAWRGIDPTERGAGQKVQLYKFTWQNPRPEVVVRSLDVVSALTNAAPFVVAITVE